MVTIQNPHGQTVDLSAEAVVVAMGRSPNVQGLNLDSKVYCKVVLLLLVVSGKHPNSQLLPCKKADLMSVVLPLCAAIARKTLIVDLLTVGESLWVTLSFSNPLATSLALVSWPFCHNTQVVEKVL